MPLRWVAAEPVTATIAPSSSSTIEMTEANTGRLMKKKMDAERDRKLIAEKSEREAKATADRLEKQRKEKKGKERRRKKYYHSFFFQKQSKQSYQSVFLLFGCKP
jgi:hypothetical protein